MLFFFDSAKEFVRVKDLLGTVDVNQKAEVIRFILKQANPIRFCLKARFYFYCFKDGEFRHAV